MRAIEHVVVALALEPSDRDLLRYARRVRELGNDEIRFTFAHVLAAADVAAFRKRPGRSRAEALSVMRAEIAEHFGDVADEDLCVRTGDRVDQLLGLAAESGSDLLLVGHRRSARGRRSVARRLAMKAPASVWMVPEGSPPGIERVIAAVDFSLPSATALVTAARIAAGCGLSTCTAVHVQEPSTTRFEGSDPSAVSRTFEQFLSPLDLHGVTVDRRVVEGGTAAGTILADSAPGYLLVMGTRGLSASAAVLLGSESEHALVEAVIPVLVTKEKGGRIGLVRALLDRGAGWPSGVPFG
jgi:nucleotide-binding universal stress UspA family protein